MTWVEYTPIRAKERAASRPNDILSLWTRCVARYAVARYRRQSVRLTVLSIHLHHHHRPSHPARCPRPKTFGVGWVSAGDNSPRAPLSAAHLALESGPRGWFHHSTIYDIERNLLWEREGQVRADIYLLVPAPDHCQRTSKADGQPFIFPREALWGEILAR